MKTENHHILFKLNFFSKKIFFTNSEVLKTIISDKSESVTEHVTEHVKKLISLMTDEHSREELMKLLNITHREYFRSEYIQKAIQLGLIEMTLPDKPNSKNQKYRLTPLGLNMKKKLRKR
ncbi:MAG: hypothetical protein OHK0036_10170 [Bacteroidia bacterium]